MLSIERCRQLIGSQNNFSDEQVAAFRDRTYDLARTVVRLIEERRGKPPVSPNTETSFGQVLETVPEGERYALEERAAIHEFDGNMTRTDAERRTVNDYLKNRGSWNKG